MKIVILVSLCLLIVGCASGPETIVKDRVITVVPPVIHDTVRTSQATDSVVIATKIIEHDTVAVIKYFPRDRYIDYKIKPDTIRLQFRDTVRQTVKVKEETPLMSKLGFVLLGIIAALIIRVFIYKNI